MTRLRAAFAIAALLAPLTVAADVRISEISYDPQGSDSKREWVEIFNTGSDAVDLSKIKFTDSSNHVLNAPPKNGSTGSLSLPPNAYAVLAADAATFRSLYPAVAEVIDTAMSLKNDGGTVSLTGPSGLLDAVQYTSALGASGDGDSLQLTDGSWIHAAPTPGTQNATHASVHQAVAVTKTVAKTAKAPVVKTATAKTVKQAVPQNDANDPMPLVNASPEDSRASQAAAVGSLGAYTWWIAAAAFAIIVGAAASVISKQKKGEWDIVEAE